MGSKQTSATPAGVARSRARLTRRERREWWSRALEHVDREWARFFTEQKEQR
jgi:hypothetical protein